MEIRVIAFEEQRTGAGRFTMQWLLHHAFDELGLHRVYLEMLESNIGGKALYESVGFEKAAFATGSEPPTVATTICYRMELFRLFQNEFVSKRDREISPTSCVQGYSP